MASRVAGAFSRNGKCAAPGIVTTWPLGRRDAAWCAAQCGIGLSSPGRNSAGTGQPASCWVSVPASRIARASAAVAP